MEEIILQLAPELADAVAHHDTASEDYRALCEVLGDLHVKIRRLHPRVSHGKLSTYFLIETSDGIDPERITAQVLGLHGVNAAYVKPPAEPAPRSDRMALGS